MAFSAESVTLEPFLLEPVLVERPWGGTRLASYEKHLTGDTSIGESWEVADLPEGVANHVADPHSRVASGPLTGATLGDVIAEAGTDLLGSIPPTPEGRFPLLFKLLDAQEHLSVQVHPHARYVADHPEAKLKTESWYIIEAELGALTYRYGVQEREIAGNWQSPSDICTATLRDSAIE